MSANLQQMAPGHYTLARRGGIATYTLDKVSNVVWELLNDSVVEPLDVLKQSLVILDDKVNGNTFAAKSA